MMRKCGPVDLMYEIDQLQFAVPREHGPICWMACEEFGTWVSSELIGPDGAGEADDGGLYCTSYCVGEED